MTFARALALAAVLSAAACGCQRQAQGNRDYQTVAADPHRDTDAARKHNADGIALLEKSDLEGAERTLKAALSADMFFGPAHNNLGTVYYRQKKFYLAAWEFQYASKLMPTKAEPRNNLGMVYELVGKLDEAAKSYEEALELEPDAVVIAGNLARIYIRTNRKDDRTRQLLGDIVLKDTRPAWVAWAQERLAIFKKAEPADSPAGPPK